MFMDVETLNHLAPAQFLEAIGGPLEGETWLAERVLACRPFVNVEALIDRFFEVANAATTDEKIQLIASHPQLGIAVAENLSEMSIREQAAAGLKQLTPQEYDTFSTLNAAYNERFGFPFVICARENTKVSILSAFEDRLKNAREDEINTGTAEVLKILRLRLLDLVA